MRKDRKLLVFLLIALFFFSLGYISYEKKDILFKLRSSDDKFDGNISKLIKIENEKDVLEIRKNLIQFIWKQGQLPTNYPVVETNIHDNDYQELKNLDKIDKLTIVMDYNFTSVLYHFYSSKPNNNLFIYHQGHDGDFVNGIKVIDELLNKGYDVIALTMPLLGKNNQPEIYIESLGNFKFISHDQFKFLDNNKFCSIKLFIEPVIVAINYADNSGYKEINMLGLSGGGWTTVMSSAVDPRISKGYSVSGSYPIFLEPERDYEQINPEVYRIANYLELYILDSYGENRKHVQIVNIYDSCCFSGDKYRSYEKYIYQKIEILGKGNYTVFADDTHNEHIISEHALNFIIDDVE